MKEQEKFQKLIDALGITVYQFGKDLGFARVEPIYKILRGETKDPSSSIYGKIKRAYPNVNLEWLVTGEGPLFIDPLNSVDAELLKKVDQLQSEYKVLERMYERAIREKALLPGKNKVAISSPGFTNDQMPIISIDGKRRFRLTPVSVLKYMNVR